MKSVDTTVHEHAHIYSLACDAYQAICQALPKILGLLPLVPHDLHVATLILDQTKSASATSSKLEFGALVKCQKMMDGTWMDDCK